MYTYICTYICIPVYVYVCDIYDMYVIHVHMHPKTRDRKFQKSMCIRTYTRVFVYIHI